MIVGYVIVVGIVSSETVDDLIAVSRDSSFAIIIDINVTRDSNVRGMADNPAAKL